MHPVESILQTTMEKIKTIVDVNTIVGSPIYGEGGAVVIPVSKVSLGMLAGGGDFPTQTVLRKGQTGSDADDYPFVGASVVGVTITPKAFLCLRSGQATLLSTECDNTLDRLVQLIPSVMRELKDAVCACSSQCKCGDNCDCGDKKDAEQGAE